MDIKLTAEQYGQLMSLLNKHTNIEEHKDQVTMNSAHLAGKQCFSEHGINNWVTDNGAFDHTCVQINLFNEYRKIEGKQNFITIPNGKQVKVDFIGNIILPNGLKLTGVLFVPSFHFNLVFVSKLVRNSKCTLWFNANYCFVQGSLKKGPLLLGKAQNALYYIEDTKDTST